MTAEGKAWKRCQQTGSSTRIVNGAWSRLTEGDGRDGSRGQDGVAGLVARLELEHCAPKAYIRQHETMHCEQQAAFNRAGARRRLTVQAVPGQVAKSVDRVERHRARKRGLDRELQPPGQGRKQLDDRARVERHSHRGEGEVSEEGGVERWRVEREGSQSALAQGRVGAGAARGGGRDANRPKGRRRFRG